MVGITKQMNIYDINTSIICFPREKNKNQGFTNQGLRLIIIY